MDMFGYFCSPFCKNKAEAQHMDAPVFEGRGDLVEKRFWKKVGTIFAVVGTAIVLFVGTWTWYAWFGAVPHVIFSVRFDDISHSGTSFIVSNQIVFLHGGTLARYDLKSKKQIWSQDLVTKQQVDDVIKQEDAAEAKAEEQYGRPEYRNYEAPELRQKHARIALEQELSLYLAGQNVWVAKENELAHYDWDSGKVLQQLALTNGFGEFTQQGDELVERDAAGETQVNMMTGQMQTTVSAPVPNPAAMVAQNPAAARTGKKPAPSQGTGLPLTPYGDASQPIDPQKVNEQMQHLTTAGRIALPAVVAGNLHQQQIYKEMESDNPNSPRGNSAASSPAEDFETVPDGDSSLLFGTKLVQENMVERDAMKAPPKKSALDSGNVSVANEGDAINEQLNEIQRTTGGTTVTEDQSLYQVTVRKPDSPDATFTTNVVGTPQLFPLKTVNIVAGGKTLIVLDKSNKKLWQADLAYTIPEGSADFSGDKPDDNHGPCVERDGTLYVYDEATLTAFDISNGNVRWRLPSVGIGGLFFDDKGMIYLSTSTASLDAIKYSKQIDINNPTQGVLMKIDPQSGKTLWSMKPRGSICYMSGKYIYTIYDFDSGDPDEQASVTGIFQPSVMFITRINPKDGKVMWEHSEARAPVDVKFDKNTIQLVFKKEVEVLHYLSF